MPEQSLDSRRSLISTNAPSLAHLYRKIQDVPLLRHAISFLLVAQISDLTGQDITSGELYRGVILFKAQKADNVGD